MNFFKGLASVVCGLAPILGAVASIVFPGGGAAVTIGTKVLGALPGLINSAEQAFGDGSGPIKKQFVMEGAQKIVETMQNISTGGQKETWDAIAPLTSTVVDGIVAAVNGLSDEPVFDVYANMKNGL
jgi:hypothetical protein